MHIIIDVYLRQKNYQLILKQEEQHCGENINVSVGRMRSACSFYTTKQRERACDKIKMAFSVHSFIESGNLNNLTFIR